MHLKTAIKILRNQMTSVDKKKSTQVGKDEIEDSEEITLHRLSTSMGNTLNISLISRSSGYFVDVKSHETASNTVNDGRRR